MRPFPAKAVYDALFARWGEQHWWPAESRLEMMIGAVLTQNTAWTNVEKAIENFRQNGALTLEALQNCTTEQLAQWIRPAGYFNQKAQRLKELTEILCTRFNGSLDALFSLETETLRKELLSWKGIGPETSDSILLYAAERPVFVVDAYTQRFLLRHDWITEKATYDEIAQAFTAQLPPRAPHFNEYHALIVRLGKEHCKSKPQCENCPLRLFLSTETRG